MKVLFVASGNKTGKPGIVVQNQADSLEEEGIDVSFFLVNGKGLPGYLKNVIPLLKVTMNYNYDLVHSHFGFSAIMTSLVCLVKPGLCHIVSLMGSDSKKSLIIRYLIRWLSNNVWNKTIVKSESMIADLRLKHALIIPNGVNVRKIQSIQNKISDGYESSKKQIIFVGDPTRASKNFDLANRSLKLLTEPVCLKVVNGISHAEVIKEILYADVVLLTSHYEGSPNTIKEAMVCNKPVVATPVGDIETLFGNEPGHFITTFEPENIAKNVSAALDFSKSKKFTNGKERICSLGLDSKSIAEKIIGVYKKALEEQKNVTDLNAAF